MSKVIIASVILLFFVIFVLLFWIIALTFSLLIFSRKGERKTGLHPETKGDK